MPDPRVVLVCWITSALALGCAGTAPGVPAPPNPDRPSYALAIHGGAGSIPRDLPQQQIDEYREGLTIALRHGARVLHDGGSSLDAVEQVLRILEDDPKFNAGKGAVFNRDGHHELDASIMNGADLSSGAVAAVGTVRNPISLARAVMEHTPHVMLVGAGAEAFARAERLEPVDQVYFFTERAHAAWVAALRGAEPRSPGVQGTVGAVALDREGNLAAGTSTGGLTAKLPGRVGDSPIIGAGTFADNRSCAVSASGRGEEFIRHGVARRIAWLTETGQLGLREAAQRLVHETLRPGEGGVIALSATGEIALVFNTPSMLRGAADSSGRFEIAIWD